MFQSLLRSMPCCLAGRWDPLPAPRLLSPVLTYLLEHLACATADVVAWTRPARVLSRLSSMVRLILLHHAMFVALDAYILLHPQPVLSYSHDVSLYRIRCNPL